MVTSSFWLWAAQRSFYLKHVRVSTVRRATVPHVEGRSADARLLRRRPGGARTVCGGRTQDARAGRSLHVQICRREVMRAERD